ncbi:MAG: D-2-hydroxyacid dehydrogenase family protein [Nitrospinaceae bacterium]|jgi:phosphoglycerate dehydrogenase-like enzyme|nr:D-2-hydroxyacid dehydrogenase family protein [Nitrospinaceae bacterium]MBT4431954.1 D-2-hydroxyacid dehydrogenase family protein [Nitrospinaceae bacterium]MBT5366885.1 D-2-hydroxyacid dehydrogenase family protein [Nitrospinaceae bacterium]MBT5948761.1 D-2-hydroxyacid dehydrogenase family protein [Nitrospinaceae bacterium]MBT6394381.1 D-2-hydroxyacid dehydrogenase family protein [Nitrospinaceae bacterium]
MKIVLPDDYSELFSGTGDLERLNTLGKVAHHTDRPASGDEMAERLADAEIILTTRFSTDFKGTDLLDRMPRLKMISIMGTRPRMVDMKRANAKNAVVSITPGSSSTSVAEHTMMFILALAKQMHIVGPEMRAGEWKRRTGIQVEGKTLSLLGFGYIGEKMVKMAQGFGMRVIVWSKNMTPERAATAGAEAASLDECMAADFVSLHLHVNDGTRGLISKERLAQMRPGAFLVNTSRAALVDMDALLDTLREGRIAGAGLDVFEPEEPLPADSPFRSLDNAIISAHSAANTLDARATQLRISVDNIEAFLNGKPTNIVTEDA